MAEKTRTAQSGSSAGAVPASGWDFLLMMLTVMLLGALGTQSLIGTLYAWWGYRTQPDFEITLYPAFIAVMNGVAGPLVVALVVVMGLCVPKRLLERRTLAAVSTVMVTVGVMTAAVSGSMATGLAVYAFAAIRVCLPVGRAAAR